jgi:hypothetical protein
LRSGSCCGVKRMLWTRDWFFRLNFYSSILKYIYIFQTRRGCSSLSPNTKKKLVYFHPDSKQKSHRTRLLSICFLI